MKHQDQKKRKQQIDQRILTEEQKLALKLQKLQPRGVLFGSQSMKNVENIMYKIYQDKNRKVVKYFSSSVKNEADLQKPLYVPITDEIKDQPESAARKPFNYLDFKRHSVMEDPLMEQEYQRHQEFKQSKNFFSLFLLPQSRPESSNKFQLLKENTQDEESNQQKRITRASILVKKYKQHRNYTEHSMKQAYFLTEPEHRLFINTSPVKITEPCPPSPLKSQKVVIIPELIDTEEKLKKYEKEKKKTNAKVFQKLGIMTCLDKKIKRIQELQARALKMRIKVNASPIFSPSSITTTIKYQMKSPENQEMTRKNLSKIQEFLMKEENPKFKIDSKRIQTSPNGASRRAFTYQQSHMAEFISPDIGQFQSFIVKKNRPQTQIAKRKILTFVDNLTQIETDSKDILKEDRKLIVGTIFKIQKDLQSWQNGLMDKNDVLDKNLTDEIKEQVYQYISQQDQKIPKY